MLGDIQDGVEHLAVRKADIAALDRQMWRDTFVLSLGEFHPMEDTMTVLISVNTP